jgi:hypothetical protein
MAFGKLLKKLFSGQPEIAEPAPENTSVRHWISNPWHAVSVVPCRGACSTARAASGRRYLSKDAPALPLKGCHVTTCACRYRHHEDRRRALRRTSDLMASSGFWAGQERRAARGRRQTDQM